MIKYVFKSYLQVHTIDEQSPGTCLTELTKKSSEVTKLEAALTAETSVWTQ